MKPETKRKNDYFAALTDEEKVAHRKAKNTERRARNQQRRAQRRGEAEARQAAYQALPLPLRAQAAANRRIAYFETQHGEVR
jgi:hypothetical protein